MNDLIRAKVPTSTLNFNVCHSFNQSSILLTHTIKFAVPFRIKMSSPLNYLVKQWIFKNTKGGFMKRVEGSLK